MNYYLISDGEMIGGWLLITYDHVANADRLEQSRVCEFISRSAADTENGCDVIHSVCSALRRSFFVGAHKTISLANMILKWPQEALCHKGFLLIPC